MVQVAEEAPDSNGEDLGSGLHGYAASTLRLMRLHQWNAWCSADLMTCHMWVIWHSSHTSVVLGLSNDTQRFEGLAGPEEGDRSIRNIPEDEGLLVPIINHT